MNIIAYQIEDGTYRFIYSASEGLFNVVAVENYRGVDTFLRYSRATKLSNDIDIDEMATDLAKSYERKWTRVQLNGDMANEFNDSFYSDML